jgi:hypothetical protein
MHLVCLIVTFSYVTLFFVTPQNQVYMSTFASFKL